jgi:hypothetical protein
MNQTQNRYYEPENSYLNKTYKVQKPIKNTVGA